MVKFDLVNDLWKFSESVSICPGPVTGTVQDSGTGSVSLSMSLSLHVMEPGYMEPDYMWQPHHLEPDSPKEFGMHCSAFYCPSITRKRGVPASELSGYLCLNVEMS